jgi:hypothetical protein
MRRVRVTTVEVEKQQVVHILSFCSLSYLARKAHAPYYIVICGLSGSNIFFHIISQRHDFRKKLLNIKCVF